MWAQLITARFQALTSALAATDDHFDGRLGFADLTVAAEQPGS